MKLCRQIHILSLYISVSFSPSHSCSCISSGPLGGLISHTSQWHIDSHISSSKGKTGIWLHLSWISTFECCSWKFEKKPFRIQRFKKWFYPLIWRNFSFFLRLSLFPCFFSVNILTSNVDRTRESKWGLKFQSNRARLNIHQTVTQQFRAESLHYSTVGEC